MSDAYKIIDHTYDTVVVGAGPEGLIIGDRVSASRRARPVEAVVH